MVDVEVQGIEVEPLVLELRPLRDLPTHADEDVADLVLQEGERVARADPRARGHGGDVDTLGLESRGDLGLGELGLLRGQRLGHLPSPLTHELAERGLVLGGDLAHRGVQDRERRSVGDVCGASRFQLGGVGGCGDRREGVGDSGFDRFRGDFRRL